MITIVEPKQHIDRLWGQQRVKEDSTYRLMRYLLQVEHDGKTLLHNVVTGQLVVLEENEAALMGKLPMKYTPDMAQMVARHYLVPEDYDEHQQVIKLREVLRRFEDTRNKAIQHYVILPTTACNARCYYCFEQGIEPVTMTEEIANEVVQFINTHSDGQGVTIQWFGGEPTVAANCISQICEGLTNNGIEFSSTMISNGYLFDEYMISQAKNIWKLRHVQITVDGTENNYNKIKSYKNNDDNAFTHVMDNVGALIKNEIAVGLRMNYDLDNYEDFVRLLDYVSKRFGSSRYLSVYSYPIIGEYINLNGVIHHGSDEWFAEKTVELNDKARDAGLLRIKHELPYMHFKNCPADDDASITINALGKLVKCAEHIQEEEWVGSLSDGIVNKKQVEQWKVNADYWKCPGCIFYPRCVKLEKCGAKDVCRAQDRIKQYRQSVIDGYEMWLLQTKREDDSYDIRETSC